MTKMKNINILIVTYDMIPYAFTWGGCQRMYFLAQNLIQEGCNVDVFALRTAKYNTFGKSILPSVYFIETPVQGQSTQDESISNSSDKNKGITGFLRRLAFKIDPLLFNEIIPGNGLQAYKRYRLGKNKLKELVCNNHYDIIIVSAPPFAIFSAIGLIKKLQPKQRIIMDYRDPWNSWHSGNRLCERREQKLQEKADAIVCTNAALCEDMSKKYGISSRKYHVIENGFMIDNNSTNNVVDVNLPHDKMNIVYTGAIGFNPISDGYRDTVPLFEALEHLMKEGNKEIRLVFIGEANSDPLYLKKLKQKFSDQLIVLGKVSSDMAKEYVRQADVCLLLHTAEDLSGKYLISGKAYDYIQAKKYIFSISRPDSQHSNIINVNKIGINVANDKLEIEKALVETLSKWKNEGFKSVYDGLDIMRYSRDYQLNKYKRIIEGLLQ